MATLLLRLVGPMQSWGTASRFSLRDTRNEPSKSGVVGLLAAAMGIPRENWSNLEPLTRLAMGVRHDRQGLPRHDFQTAACATTDTIIRANGSETKDGVVSKRFYLTDAAFLVGLESPDHTLLEALHQSLRNPVWPLFLGRKSFVPSESIWIENGLVEAALFPALEKFPWLGETSYGQAKPMHLRLTLESQDGTGLMVMDQPISPFSERQFGARFLTSHLIPFPQVTSHAPA